eukprot:655078-Amphidinium_carterae.1
MMYHILAHDVAQEHGTLKSIEFHGPFGHTTCSNRHTFACWCPACCALKSSSLCSMCAHGVGASLGFCQVVMQLPVALRNVDLGRMLELPRFLLCFPAASALLWSRSRVRVTFRVEAITYYLGWLTCQCMRGWLWSDPARQKIP